jgi:hypothetical protein
MSDANCKVCGVSRSSDRGGRFETEALNRLVKGDEDEDEDDDDSTSINSPEAAVVWSDDRSDGCLSDECRQRRVDDVPAV